MNQSISFWQKLKLFLTGLYFAKATKKLKTDMKDVQFSQELQQSVIDDLDTRTNELEDIDRLTANAVANIDNRLEALEKLAGYLYSKFQDHEERITQLENRAVSEDLNKFSVTTSVKSDAN